MSNALFSVSSVSVKEYTSADMDVTRATAATRVDENGLVNYAEVLGGEELNGTNFPSPNTAWTVAAGGATTPVFNNSVLLVNGNKIYQSILNAETTYIVTYEVSANVGSSQLRYYNGSGYVNIDSSIGEHTLYFTTAASILNRFYFNVSSGTSVTVLSASVKEVTRDNVPRIDYTGGGCPHILAEPMRTNLVPYSEDFSSWTTVSATLTPNQLSPDGTNNAYIVEDDNASGSGYEKVDVTITTTATPCTLSVFIKKKTSSVSAYSGIQMGTGFSYLIFDSYNGTYNQSSNTNYDSIEVENFNSDWWRLKLTATVTTSTRVALWGAISSNGTTISPSATGSETFWGAQLEVGSYATSYIPTNGEAAGVTRNQDIFTRDGIGSLIGSEGVFYAEFKVLHNYQQQSISISDGTINTRVLIYATSGGVIRGQIKGSTSVGVNDASGATATDFNKVAIRYKDNRVDLSVNGATIVTSTITNISPTTLNQLSFTAGVAGSGAFEGQVRNIQVYDSWLTDDQLTSLTT
tara:strand:+ start:38 stop:1600 length:1563 start_codon:yes stop_codon:yes gene_type:complete